MACKTSSDAKFLEILTDDRSLIQEEKVFFAWFLFKWYNHEARRIYEQN